MCRFATLAMVLSSVLAAQGPADDARKLWVYEGGWFAQDKGDAWYELNEETHRRLGKPAQFREVKRDKEHVEMYDTGRKVTVRISETVLEAIDALRAILRIDAKDRYALVNLADISFQQQIFNKSVEYYEKYLALAPEDSNARARYGSSLSFLGKHDQAVASIVAAPRDQSHRRAGHTVGEFPHEKIDGDRITLYIHPDNHQPLRSRNAEGKQRHWILEMHLVDKAKRYGAFFEELITIG